MASRTSLVDIDGNKNQLNNWVVQVLAAAPGSPSQGQIWYRSNVANGAGNGVIYYRDSSGNDIAIATGGSALSNAYVAMTDGTTTTTTSGGETLQVIASGTGLTVAVVNNNASFGNRDTITYTLNSAVSGANKVLLLDASGGIAHNSYVKLGLVGGTTAGTLGYIGAGGGDYLYFWHNGLNGPVQVLDSQNNSSVNGTLAFYKSPNISQATPTAANTGEIGYSSLNGTIVFANGTLVHKVATWDGSETWTNKTLTTPVLSTPQITNFNSAQHNHSSGSQGGTLTSSSITNFTTAVQAIQWSSMAVPTGSVSMNSQKIINLLDPTSAQDAATKNYVDISIQGFDWKLSARAATTATVTLAGGAPNTLDGLTLVVGDRILVKDQSTASQNGIYTVTTVGTGANGTWTRATDADSSAEVTAGLAVFISEGTVNGNNGFVLTTDDPIVLNTTSLVFTQFSGAGQIIAGNGLAKSGNTLSVVTVSSARITVGGSGIDLASGIVTPGTYFSTTVDTYGRVTAGADIIGAGGFPARTAAFTYAARTMTGTATRLVITNGDGVAGNPTFDLGQPTIGGSGATSGISLVTVDVYGRVTSTSEIITATGIPARTAAGAWSARTITGTAGNINVTNGNGVSGNPTIDLPNVGTAGTYDQVTTDAQGRVTAGVVSGSSGTMGDGSATSFVVTHSLGTRNVHVTVYRSTTPWDEVDIVAEHTSTTTCTIRFNVAPSIGEYTVYVSR